MMVYGSSASSYVGFITLYKGKPIKKIKLGNFSIDHRQEDSKDEPSTHHKTDQVTNLVLRVSRLHSVTYRNRTPIFEWWVITCRSKNRHGKGIMYL